MSELEVFNQNHEKLKEHRVWVKFVNSLSGFKSANLVATKSKNNQENLSIVSSVVHLGAKPPLLGVVFRPHSDESPRHSYENILETGVFTLNHVNESIFKKAHQTSARYPREISEFEKVGLTPEYRDNFHAPFVKESKLQMSLKYKKTYHIEENGTHFLVAEVINAYAPLDSLREDGSLDIDTLSTVAVSGLDAYYSAQKLARLSYAKPNKKVEEI